MEFKFIKKPEYENDSCLFELRDFAITMDMISRYAEQDEYLALKRKKFREQNIDKADFEKIDKASLRGIKNIATMEGSIYTYAASQRNDMTYENIIFNVYRMLKETKSRRIVVRMLNSFKEYFRSELASPKDVSCLAFIHYLPDEVKLVFRASHSEEIFYDIVTIYEFFIFPIYEYKNLKISVFSTTCQGIENYTFGEFHDKQ